jgi:hypothetical protein
MNATRNLWRAAEPQKEVQRFRKGGKAQRTGKRQSRERNTRRKNLERGVVSAALQNVKIKATSLNRGAIARDVS